MLKLEEPSLNIKNRSKGFKLWLSRQNREFRNPPNLAMWKARDVDFSHQGLDTTQFLSLINISRFSLVF